MTTAPRSVGSIMTAQLETRFWLPDADHGYVKATLTGQDNKKSLFLLEDGSTRELPHREAEALGPVHDEHLFGEQNICNLATISEGALLSTVRVRFEQKQIYTNVARIVLAINPFEDLPIYTPQMVDKYKSGDGACNGPHVFGIGADAFHGLMSNRVPQAVLISGESGAGKTESTKHVLSYLADVGGNSELQVENKILSTNPVLEAFGNAKTVRNNNSSRFGKWIQVIFLKKMEIEGAVITDYLLETTRIIQQTEQERNYHIFYQLLSGTPAAKRPDLGLESKPTPADFEYLKYSQPTAPGLQDHVGWTETEESFLTIGFTRDDVKSIMQIVSGVLHLGNVGFDPDKNGEGSKVSADKMPVLQKAAKLLGLSDFIPTLSECLTTKKIYVGKEVTEIYLNKTKARHARDAVAKLVYHQMFKDMIKVMNESLVSSDKTKVSTDNYIGILDIAGFESFEVNSLEQLFINLSNETLQQYFNNYVFKSELDDYRAEDVPVDQIRFNDNLDILELIQGKGGILDQLDEELTVTRGSEANFVSRINKAFGGDEAARKSALTAAGAGGHGASKESPAGAEHSRFLRNKFGESKFAIHHFAGDVEYDCAGWLEKNLDEVPKETIDLMKFSANTFLHRMGKSLQDKHLVGGTGGGGGGGPARGPPGKAPKRWSVSLQFRHSLKKLIDEIKLTDPHFIRCIKPNMEKVPAKFCGKPVMEQLLNSGAMEAVRIRQSGYPFRLSFGDFMRRFFCVIPRVIRRDLLQKQGLESTSKTAVPDMGAVCRALATKQGMTNLTSYLPMIML